MPSSPASSAHRDPASTDLVKPDLQAEYDFSRDKVERLMAEPVKDYPAIDQLVDRLEVLQLAIKGEHGLKGNNPNE